MSDTTQDPKTYPVSSPEVAQMLGLPLDGAAKTSQEQSDSAAADNTSESAKPEGFSQIVGNLYVKGEDAKIVAPLMADKTTTQTDLPSARAAIDLHMESIKKNVIVSNLFQTLKTITPYVLVFSAALFVYFYFFGNISFSLSKIFPAQSVQTQKVASAKETSLTQLQSQNLTGYYQWIGQFYYDVSDASVLDPNADNSGNGLTNFQKYLLNLNPKSYDTLGLGVSDSEEINQGTNPLTNAPLTDAQKSVIDKYFDMEVVMNRLALAQMKKSGQVAGAETGLTPAVSGDYGFGQPVQTAQAAPLTIRGNAAPQNSQAVPAVNQPHNSAITPSVAEPLNSAQQINNNTPGRLQIPSLKIDVPLIWSADPKNFDKDLQSGVIHYPGTAMPGEIGTAYISGHSSNYSWAKGSYNQIFTHLDKLADDASFSITVKTSDGRTSVFHYVVTSRQQYGPTDQAQFKNGAQSIVALSTCWPVGSTKYRYVVFGQLTQVEQQ